MTADDPRTAVVLVAAGSGTRVGGTTNKVLLPLLGTPVLAWSLRTLSALAYVDRLVVVVRREDADVVEGLVEQHRRPDQEAWLVEGGDTRHASEWRGLRTLGTGRRRRGRSRSWWCTTRPARWPVRSCSTRRSAPPVSTVGRCRCARSGDS